MMATHPEIDGIPVDPQLNFESNPKSWMQMSQLESKMLTQIWVQNGRAIAASIAMLNDERDGATDDEKLVLNTRLVKLERALSKWSTLLDEIQVNDAIIKPPQQTDFEKVMEVVGKVGRLQQQMQSVQALLKTATQVLSIAQQVLAAKPPAPAPVPAPATAPAAATTG